MIKLYYSEPKELLPGVLLDKESGNFQIVGTSCPMEPFEFFVPILNWFDEYGKEPLDETILVLNFNYFNTSSSKFLLKILYKLENIQETGKYVRIDWYYSEDDEDMLEEAEEFENIVDLEFDLIPLSNTAEEAVDDEYLEMFYDE